MEPRVKILELEDVASWVKNEQEAGQIIGLCHGCFDVLHVGHLRHFVAAKNQCDLLVISVTPDRFINKGPNRPVFPSEQRSELIAGLSVSDVVCVNRWESAVNLINLLKPNIFFKGQEYENNASAINPLFLLEAEAIQSIGGVIKFTHEWTSSSSAAIKKMNNVN